MPTTHERLTIDVKGATETVRAFSRYGRDCSADLRDAGQGAVDRIAPMLVTAMNRDGGPSALVATSIVSRRDRYPTIKAGGAKALNPRTRRRGRRPRAGDLFFGAEFGGRGRRTTQQFRPWRGTLGYAFYPTLRAHRSDVIDAWQEALNRLAEKWAHGGSE
jgi:hypothetical protein